MRFLRGWSFSGWSGIGRILWPDLGQAQGLIGFCGLISDFFFPLENKAWPLVFLRGYY